MATKSIFDWIQSLTGISGLGAALVDATLALGESGVPLLAVSSLRTQTEKDEQTGLLNLVKGLDGLYRNPTARDPRLNRTINDASAVVFAARFYSAVAFAQSVSTALEQAKVAMEVSALDDAVLPEIRARENVDPASLVLVKPVS